MRRACLLIERSVQIDEFIEQNIQINSNKEIRREYLNAWTLKFIDKSQEQKFCQLREDMFRCVDTHIYLSTCGMPPNLWLLTVN